MEHVVLYTVLNPYLENFPAHEEGNQHCEWDIDSEGDRRYETWNSEAR